VQLQLQYNALQFAQRLNDLLAAGVLSSTAILLLLLLLLLSERDDRQSFSLCWKTQRAVQDCTTVTLCSRMTKTFSLQNMNNCILLRDIAQFYSEVFFFLTADYFSEMHICI